MEKRTKLMISIPRSVKAQLDLLRSQGTSASGFIRHLLEQHFASTAKKGR